MKDPAFRWREKVETKLDPTLKIIVKYLSGFTKSQWIYLNPLPRTFANPYLLIIKPSKQAPNTYWPPSGTTCPIRAYMEIMIFSLVICFQTPPHKAHFCNPKTVYSDDSDPYHAGMPFITSVCVIPQYMQYFQIFRRTHLCWELDISENMISLSGW
jgi:hypothetical protein